MLLTEVDTEARALLHLAEELGEDPEPTAEKWAEATVAEVKAVVRKVFALRPDLKGSEWYEDFTSAHRRQF
jgi:hypothetical protein